MGILANSASVSHASSSSDDTKSGYLNQEPIGLTLSVSASSYRWSLTKPVNSTAQSRLSDDDAASVSFVPDVAGYYVISCLVDGTTTNVLRISVTDTVVATVKEALRLMPKAHSQIAIPATGAVIFYSSELSAVAVMDSSGNVTAIA